MYLSHVRSDDTDLAGGHVVGGENALEHLIWWVVGDGWWLVGGG